MLGLVNNKWTWAAFGKHRVAKDYIYAGTEDPMFRAFSGWLEKGYSLLENDKNSSSQRIWRFWTKGPGKHKIVCGVVKDSSDSIGRPFPFVMMGIGQIKKWEKFWPLLPYTCDRVWRQMESRCSKGYADVKHMEDDLSGIQPPHSDWQVYANQRGNPKNFKLLSSYDASFEKNIIASMSGKDEAFLSFGSRPADDPLTLAGSWHYFYQIHLKDMPNSVFIGGNLDHTGMAILKRPLSTADFKHLWTLDPRKGDNNGA